LTHFLKTCRHTGNYRVPLFGHLARSTERKVLKNATWVFGLTDKVARSLKDTYGIIVEENLPDKDLISFKAFREKENALLS
jgi:hypothetical protein